MQMGVNVVKVNPLTVAETYVKDFCTDAEHCISCFSWLI